MTVNSNQLGNRKWKTDTGTYHMMPENKSLRPSWVRDEINVVNITNMNNLQIVCSRSVCRSVHCNRPSAAPLVWTHRETIGKGAERETWGISGTLIYDLTERLTPMQFPPRLDV